MAEARILPALLMLSLAACNESPARHGSDGTGNADTGPRVDTKICAEVNVDLDQIYPYVTLLIDQSTSMEQDFGGVSRWQAVYDTLMASGTGVVHKLQGSVAFGLALYTSHGGSAGGTCPVITGVNHALNNHPAIDAVYAPAAPDDETPTGDSIDVEAAKLKQLAGGGARVIVLATDGEPDTCARPNPQDGQPEAIAAAQKAFTAGIQTYIISVGNDVSDGHLQDMANAGAGLAVGGATNAPFYRALKPDDLVQAFSKIIHTVQDCRFALKGSINIAFAGQGTVKLDGKLLAFGTQWRLIDDHTLELLGDACTTLLDGSKHAVSAAWPCIAIE